MLTTALGTAVGTGFANTIISRQGAISTNYAAGLALAYNGGHYADWYLLSKNELYQLYLKKNIIGNFSNYEYWSSTDSQNNDSARSSLINMNTGVDDEIDKGRLCHIRAIRAF